ncbi:MAG: ATP-dependent helicase [Planctomycetota bacterium]|nr:ATP-dependent helicase [Planctomycetota bacterium]
MIPPILDRARDGWPHGPRRLVLLGPPGTGKTYSVLETWLVPALAAGVRREEVLACSFSVAAATEISERLARRLGGEPDDYRACSKTIHAEARRLVAERRGDIQHREGRMPTSAAGDDVDDAEEEGGRREPLDKGKLRTAMLRAWSLARNLLHEDLAGVDVGGDFALEDLEEDRRAYEADKRLRRQLDFTDLLQIALEEGEAPYRRLLVVDEAQDLTPLQWLLVARWARAAERVVIVGDMDQAIHAWAGADCAQIHANIADGWAVRRLGKSRRVPAAAHTLARGLIARNVDRLDAPYEPADRAGVVVESTRLRAGKAALEAWRQGREVLWLARTSRLVQSHAQDLLRAGVPFHAERGFSPLGSPTSLAAARAIVAFREGRRARVEDVRALLGRLPARGFFASRQKEATRLEVGTWPERVLVAREDLEALGMTLGALLERPIQEAFAAAKFERRAEHLARFVELHGARAVGDLSTQASSLAATSPGSISGVAGAESHGGEVRAGRNQGLERSGTAGSHADHTRAGRVVLTTMHASKGREADLVVVDMLIPGLVARDLGERAEDERRLLYVALTRTKDELLLLRAPADRDLGDRLGMPALHARTRGTPACACGPQHTHTGSCAVHGVHGVQLPGMTALT